MGCFAEDDALGSVSSFELLLTNDKSVNAWTLGVGLTVWTLVGASNDLEKVVSGSLAKTCSVGIIPQEHYFVSKFR